MNHSSTIIHAFTVPISLTFIEGQSSFFCENCLDTQLICSKGDFLTEFAHRYRIRFETVPYTRKITPWHDLMCLWYTYQIFRRVKPAIVHGNTPKAGLLSMLAARMAGVPVRVYEIHGFPFESRKGFYRWLMMGMERLSCRAATNVLIVSDSLHTLALNQRIASAKKLTVPHRGSCNGVDARLKFNPDNLDECKLQKLKETLGLKGRCIGFVGRLTRDKGIVELALAWKMIRQDFPDLTLILVGSSEMELSPEKEIIDELLLDTRVHWVDFVTDVEYYFALLDFILLPTYREGLPNVLLEAGAMEVPAIVSRVTGTVDAVVENETGLFCEPRSPESLVEKIRIYLTDHDMVRRHGHNARKRVLLDFDPLDVWEAKHRVYKKALQTAGIDLHASKKMMEQLGK
ncbi:glycosyltransferase family 4 protein [Larkinella sp. C7]|uniref:glycosyltransferase family 4 protein n=1 Tax=Larkinella sp. C7 TaxID=2576607 RepID=UPI001487563E|nr:glycosyltransferase family 4 protein [Larkinella sp. C7]